MCKSSFSYLAGMYNSNIVYYYDFWHKPLKHWININTISIEHFNLNSNKSIFSKIKLKNVLNIHKNLYLLKMTKLIRIIIIYIIFYYIYKLMINNIKLFDVLQHN